MATQTSNLQLTKPESTDFYDISVQNENMDRIDEVIAGKADKTDIPIATSSQVGGVLSGSEISVDEEGNAHIELDVLVATDDEEVVAPAPLNADLLGGKTAEYFDNKISANSEGIGKIRNDLSVITAIAKDVITVENTTTTPIPLSVVHNIGGIFTINNNSLVCNRTGYIEVSATMKLLSCQLNKYYALRITRNNGLMFDVGTQSASATNTSTSIVTLTISPRLLAVSTGDVVGISLYGGADSSGAQTSEKNNVCITVKFIQ
ncbi:hypothetical protein [Anaerosporobacter sp.]|uniref:hypothetical protein n=1 Tax=Anaerosporobacter sp. TaxID=1872529 RepID=UPI00286EDC27|nr:hypothetical protein [Anaerosporobacter sp.]